MDPDTVPSPSEPDRMLLKTTLRTRLPFRAELADVVSLCGDASNRRYYRLALTNGPVPSLILMQLADPEGFKASEEAVSGPAPTNTVQELPFLYVLRLLSRAGITVPALHYYDEAAGLLYLEDFGDLTLFRACLENKESVRTYYPPAIDTLVQMQLRLTSYRTADQVCSHAFDEPLLMWEFEHFLEYGIGARHDDKPLRADHEQAIRREFSTVAALLAGQPQVFTHRDYHSRNLMIDGDRLGVLDFQDALLGPATYDLASLLRDSYVDLDEAFVDEMIDRYLAGMCAGLEPDLRERMVLTDHAAFRRLFDFTSIQRNLKAAGRFVYIDRVKGNPGFLADIPRTLGYVRRNLETYPELHSLLSHLTPYVPEWR